jgi:nucleoside-diphosphate-sugar epimerase
MANDLHCAAALVTGGTGFIGRRLVDALRRRGASVAVITRDARRAGRSWGPDSVVVHQVDIGADNAKIMRVCNGADTIFHLAGYAHEEDADQAGAQHQRVTVSGTERLLRAAASCGVQRFVFLSSVKAMGEGANERLDETAPAAPVTDYGRAKLEAERLVLEAGRKHGMHVSVLRLPLVYGPGNKGNIPRMIAAIDRGRFPPLPETGNRRSMVHVDDVVQALLLTTGNSAANGQIYIVTDGREYSTREMYEAICAALGRIVPGWSVPLRVLRLGARTGDVLQHVAGRPMPLTTGTLDKLLGSAWYNSGKIRRQLGFASRHTFFDALPEIIAEYRAGPATQVEGSSGV